MSFVVRGPEPRRHLPRYKNVFRWRIMPGENASQAGFRDRSFGNKADALKYQKAVKLKFPDEPCALCDTGRYYDAEGHIYTSRE